MANLELNNQVDNQVEIIMRILTQQARHKLLQQPTNPLTLVEWMWAVVLEVGVDKVVEGMSAQDLVVPRIVDMVVIEVDLVIEVAVEVHFSV